ncbi:hypothetical protein RSOLAG1IB_03471 [Rhizoctonia solani AG-1 IB]|uniref:Uncharacterized protein n=1 Tax=Thanatephorus cucumeris (strain AG1-IB / isolate 7/3/14) TaxID=1108050 RepID=A0A0B7FTI8_THACB|nr:hypothetical protein RSOLAG1IB_03471 [Rhizoctonia solani AG-1 IB]
MYNLYHASSLEPVGSVVVGSISYISFSSSVSILPHLYDTYGHSLSLDLLCALCTCIYTQFVALYATILTPLLFYVDALGYPN